MSSCAEENDPDSTKLPLVHIHRRLPLPWVGFFSSFVVVFPVSPPTDVSGLPLSIRLGQEGLEDCQQKIQHLFLVREDKVVRAKLWTRSLLVEPSHMPFRTTLWT